MGTLFLSVHFLLVVVPDPRRASLLLSGERSRGVKNNNDHLLNQTNATKTYPIRRTRCGPLSRTAEGVQESGSNQLCAFGFYPSLKVQRVKPKDLLCYLETHYLNCPSTLNNSQLTR